MNNIMLDLETLDTEPTAAIASIGAVKMDLNNFALGESFYCIVDPVTCQRLGLTLGADTVRWWLNQSDAARAIFAAGAGPTFDLQTALARFAKFAEQPAPPSPCVEREPLLVWGNGAAFDNVILRNAYRAAGLAAPWAYSGDRCYRTARRLFPSVAPPRTLGVKHNALGDAVFQAEHLLSIARHMKNTARVAGAAW